MREIKFKCYDKISKKIKKVYEISFENNKAVAVRCDDMYWRDIKDVILLQYTGLKEKKIKNKKEIYEGDIILVEELESFGIDKFIAVVEYDDKNACFVMNENGVKHPFWNIDYVYIKILGNIYENPELLEEGNHD